MTDDQKLQERAETLRNDPEVASWIVATREQVASGEIARRLANQPDDPRALLEGIRKDQAE